MQSNRKQSATKSHRQLARGLLADVEVLMKPAARRAEDAAFAPAKLESSGSGLFQSLSIFSA
jgi:hypothetical protein